MKDGPGPGGRQDGDEEEEEERGDALPLDPSTTIWGRAAQSGSGNGKWQWQVVSNTVRQEIECKRHNW